MSENIFVGSGLYLTRFVGPSGLEGDARRRYQVTIAGSDAYAILRRDDIVKLSRVLEKELNRD